MYPDQQPEQNLPPAPQQQPLPPVPAQPPFPPQTPHQQAEEPLPGKTLGILGFIFAFVFLSGVGLVLSIISLVKAKRAGRNNGLAIAGIVLNIFSTIFVIGLFAAITVVSYNGVAARANTSSARAAASTVFKYAEAFNADTMQYPTSYSAISSAVGSSVTQTKTVFTTEPSTPQTVEFYTCGTFGNKIGYWNYEESTVTYLYTGTASSSANCSFVTE